MPKTYIGGRARRRGERYKVYDVYDKKGFVHNIKVLMAKEDSSNDGIPQFSNARNTTYFLAKKKDDGEVKIISIAIYKNHKVVENIDLNEIDGLHFHTWRTKTKRNKFVQYKIKGHQTDLTAKHLKLIKYAEEWNDR